MIGRTVRRAIRAIALRILRRRMMSREAFRAQLTTRERLAIGALLWPLLDARAQDEIAMTPLDVAMIDAVAGESAGEVRLSLQGGSVWMSDEKGNVLDIWFLDADAQRGVR